MAEMGQFEPAAAYGPSREPGTGRVTLPRLTTSEEQRMEVMDAAAQFAAENKADSVRVIVKWPNADPTMLDISMSVEHIEGRRVYLPDVVTEMTLGGAEIPVNEAARLDRLVEEVSELHERGML